MTKNLILFFIIFFFTIKCFSQSNTFDYGLKGGIDYFNYPIEDFSGKFDKKYKVGFFLGIYTKFKLNATFDLQPELIFRKHQAIEKRRNLTTIRPSGATAWSAFPKEVEVSDYIIQFPIIVKYNLSNKLDLGFGPQMTYIIDRQFKATPDTPGANDPIGEAKIISENDYDKFDIGISLIINYKIIDKVSLFFAYTSGFLERDNRITSSYIDLGLYFRLN